MTKAKFLTSVLTIVLVVLPTITWADQADDIIRAWMSERQIPGAALIVLRNGQVFKKANYGYADLADKTPVTDATVFEIASMTKQFTAAAIMMLVEEKKLGLDDPISRHLPDLPANWRNITIRRLLDHTSGLYDDWNENNEYFLTKNSDQEFLEALKLSKLKFAPGDRYAYSCGPFIAGIIIAKVTGMSYAEFMRRRIFEPLGMSSTFVNGSRAETEDEAVGYVLRNGSLQNGVRLPTTAHARADVGISTTATDLVRWLDVHRNAKLLKRKSLSELFEFAKLNDGSSIPSGLGWWLNPIRGEPVRHHGGAFRTGFNSTINWYPKSELAVILLANQFRAGANDIGHMVAGVYDPTYSPASRRKPVTDPSPERTRALFEMLLNLSQGREGLANAHRSFPYRYYERSDWSELLQDSEGMEYLGCDDILRRGDRLFNERISEICFFRTKGNNVRPVSFLLDKNKRVLDIEPYEY